MLAFSALLKVIFIIYLQHKEKQKQAGFLWSFFSFPPDGQAPPSSCSDLHFNHLHTPGASMIYLPIPHPSLISQAPHLPSAKVLLPQRFSFHWTKPWHVILFLPVQSLFPLLPARAFLWGTTLLQGMPIKMTCSFLARRIFVDEIHVNRRSRRSGLWGALQIMPLAPTPFILQNSLKTGAENLERKWACSLSKLHSLWTSCPIADHQ